MSVSKNAKKQDPEGGSAKVDEPIIAGFRKSVRKAPGTRAGTLQDWRQGSTKSPGSSGRLGKAIRDGR
ncbi:MAG TPA: hypothetical protein VN643_10455 [Pyrinomonadaceae bacterium]|nr:hypothetical protein [Pyrinomonadaceae bacterium]